MACTKYSIRRLRTLDIDKVVNLLNLVFRPVVPLTQRWWDWKYKNNPAGFWGEEGDICVAESDDGLVGYYAIIPERFKVGIQTTTIAQSVDTAVHPEYRRIGVFSTLAQRVYHESQGRYLFLFGFPSGMAHEGFLKLGWKDFQVAEFVKFINYDRPLKSFCDKDFVRQLGKTVLKSWENLNIFQPKLLSRAKGASADIQKVDRFPYEIDDFWQKARLDKSVVLERTSVFLNWRFSKWFGDYQIHIGRNPQDGDILGYAVFRKTQIRYGQIVVENVLDIVDLCALPDEDKFVSDAISLAIKTSEQEGLDLVHLRAPEWHRYSKILHRSGFIKVSRILEWLGMYQPRGILYDFGAGRMTSIIPEWFYTLADTDYA